MTVRVIHGDCRDVLPTLEAGSFHSCVTDPPYHLLASGRNGSPRVNNPETPHGRTRLGDRGFMGKQWDGGDIAFQPETWAEVLRVLRPGAFMVAFASTRGYHRMACAIEDAGFVIHPMIGWVFGSGFPKATRFKQPELDGWRYGLQALKPALEPICLAQKPLKGTGSENWAAHGCGGLNVDGCRVDIGAEIVGDGSKNLSSWRRTEGRSDLPERPDPTRMPNLGRWPANLIHDGSEEVLAAFPDAPGMRAPVRPDTGKGHKTNGIFGSFATNSSHDPRNDSGSAARFFYAAKADAADRAGSKHPTVKPLDLMRWLTRLVTPPGGHVLDPFAGTGPTGEAARLEGFTATLIERELEYISDIRRRLGRPAGADAPLFAGVA